MHPLGILADYPVLRLRVPVRQIAPRQRGHPRLLLARRKGDPVELAEHNYRVVGTAEGDILFATLTGSFFWLTQLTSCGTSSPATSPVFVISADTWIKSS